ncbi:hypothetical protein BSKO_12798 [Bryopsis sp. KO-2023]|nr:hypothetical protein BSKO_12798 [Bryopsis sp. KO-2023]
MGSRCFLRICCKDSLKGLHYRSRWHALVGTADFSWIDNWEVNSIKRISDVDCTFFSPQNGPIRKKNHSAGLKNQKSTVFSGKESIKFPSHNELEFWQPFSATSISSTPLSNLPSANSRRANFRSTRAKFSSSGPGRNSSIEYLNSLVNYEGVGVPKNAGCDGEQGFPLDRIRKLLDGLGNPQDDLKIVHVAGSKGKGSTSAFIGAILQASGLKVGVFTSPHIVSVNERIHLNGGIGPPVSTEELEELIDMARPVIESMKESGEPPTYFEVLTAAAFKKFSMEKVDIGVIEVGLGGATDATNVFKPENVLVSVIAPIAHEHLEALGGTLESIAKAKAGIMKNGRPCITSQQEHEIVREVLEKTAESSNSTLSVAGKTESVEFLERKLHPDGACQEIKISTEGYCLEGNQSGDWSEKVVMPFMGDHQAGNIALALRAVLEVSKQGWKIPPGSVTKGLQAVRLPGRCQVFRPNKDSPWVLLDGAHTKESAASMVESKSRLFPFKTVTALVIAMLEGKEHFQVMQAFLRLEPQVVIFTTSLPFEGKRSVPPGTLVAHWEMAESGFRTASGGPFRCRKMIQASISSAIHRAITEIESIPGEGLVCVAGSMYAVSEALGCLNLESPTR